MKTFFSPIERGTQLSFLWLFAILNMVFRDIHELTMASTIAEIQSGRLNGTVMSEGLLLAGALIVELLLLMMLLSRFLAPVCSRAANLIFAPIAVVLTLLARPSDLDDYFFAAVEILAFLIIFLLALKWRMSPRPGSGQ